jgi:hypothetical protein
MKIGITERGDASFNLKWKKWIKQGNPAILITKQPEILVNQLVEIDNPNIIIHCTITEMVLLLWNQMYHHIKIR